MKLKKSAWTSSKSRHGCAHLFMSLYPLVKSKSKGFDLFGWSKSARYRFSLVLCFFFSPTPPTKKKISLTWRNVNFPIFLLHSWAMSSSDSLSNEFSLCEWELTWNTGIRDEGCCLVQGGICQGRRWGGDKMQNGRQASLDLWEDFLPASDMSWSTISALQRKP